MKEEYNVLEDLPFEYEFVTAEKIKTQTPITLEELEEKFNEYKEWLHAQDVDTYCDMLMDDAITEEERDNLIEESYHYYEELGHDMNLAQKLEFINDLNHETEFIVK